MIFYDKVNKELFESHPEIAEKFLAKEFHYKRKRMKGVKVFTNSGIKSSYLDGDNFAKNLVTIWQYYDVYKKPRFIK